MEKRYWQMIGENIRLVRKKKGLTQLQLAEYAEINYTYVGHIEQGARFPSVKVLFQIAKVLDMELSDVFQFKPEGSHSLRKDLLLVQLYHLLQEKDEQELEQIIELLAKKKAEDEEEEEQ